MKGWNNVLEFLNELCGKWEPHTARILLIPMEVITSAKDFSI